MSRFEDEMAGEAAPGGCLAVEMVIRGRVRDIGGLNVARLLPYAKRRAIGPFVFFDRMGPVGFAPGTGLDVPPHPHIGLATLTYLFQGAIVHRDSLGTVATIRPGAVNLMTAGHGVAHSERTAPEDRPGGSVLDGVQIWLAQPKPEEQGAPGFAHHAAEDLPELRIGTGIILRVVAGEAYGARSPVEAPGGALCLDLALEDGTAFEVPDAAPERGLVVIDGAVLIDGEPHEAGMLAVLRAGSRPRLQAAGGAARVMLIGGPPLDGPRSMWWNFVASDPALIEDAKRDWASGDPRFPAVAEEDSRLPLPQS